MTEMGRFPIVLCATVFNEMPDLRVSIGFFFVWADFFYVRQVVSGSVGPYWWPDPSKPDGLPYIRKDGHKNPERGKIGDSGRASAMQKAVP